MDNRRVVASVRVPQKGTHMHSRIQQKDVCRNHNNTEEILFVAEYNATKSAVKAVSAALNGSFAVQVLYRQPSNNRRAAATAESWAANLLKRLSSTIPLEIKTDDNDSRRTHIVVTVSRDGVDLLVYPLPPGLICHHQDIKGDRLLSCTINMPVQQYASLLRSVSFSAWMRELWNPVRVLKTSASIEDLLRESKESMENEEVEWKCAASFGQSFSTFVKNKQDSLGPIIPSCGRIFVGLHDDVGVPVGWDVEGEEVTEALKTLLLQLFEPAIPDDSVLVQPYQLSPQSTPLEFRHENKTHPLVVAENISNAGRPKGVDHEESVLLVMALEQAQCDHSGERHPIWLYRQSNKEITVITTSFLWKRMSESDWIAKFSSIDDERLRLIDDAFSLISRRCFVVSVNRDAQSDDDWAGTRMYKERGVEQYIRKKDGSHSIAIATMSPFQTWLRLQHMPQRFVATTTARNEDMFISLERSGAPYLSPFPHVCEFASPAIADYPLHRQVVVDFASSDVIVLGDVVKLAQKLREADAHHNKWTVLVVCSFATDIEHLRRLSKAMAVDYAVLDVDTGRSEVALPEGLLRNSLLTDGRTSDIEEMKLKRKEWLMGKVDLPMEVQHPLPLPMLPFAEDCLALVLERLAKGCSYKGRISFVSIRKYMTGSGTTTAILQIVHRCLCNGVSVVECQNTNALQSIDWYGSARPSGRLLVYFRDDIGRNVIERLKALRLGKERGTSVCVLYATRSTFYDSDITAEPVLVDDGCRKVANILSESFADSSKALQQALCAALASKYPSPDRHIFIFGITAARAEYVPITRLIEDVLGKASAETTKWMMAMAFLHVFLDKWELREENVAPALLKKLKEDVQDGRLTGLVSTCRNGYRICHNLLARMLLAHQYGVTWSDGIGPDVEHCLQAWRKTVEYLKPHYLGWELLVQRVLVCGKTSRNFTCLVAIALRQYSPLRQLLQNKGGKCSQLEKVVEMLQKELCVDLLDDGHANVLRSRIYRILSWKSKFLKKEKMACYWLAKRRAEAACRQLVDGDQEMMARSNQFECEAQLYLMNRKEVYLNELTQGANTLYERSSNQDRIAQRCFVWKSRGVDWPNSLRVPLKTKIEKRREQTGRPDAGLLGPIPRDLDGVCWKRLEIHDRVRTEGGGPWTQQKQTPNPWAATHVMRLQIRKLVIALWYFNHYNQNSA